MKSQIYIPWDFSIGFFSPFPRSPMLDHLVTQHGLTLRGNTFVEGLDLEGDRVAGLRCRARGGGSEVLEARAETLCMYMICI